MDDGRADLIEVLERVDDLHDDGAALLLCHQLVLLQVEVQVIALAVLQHSAKPAKITTGEKKKSKVHFKRMIRIAYWTTDRINYYDRCRYYFFCPFGVAIHAGSYS